MRIYYRIGRKLCWFNSLIFSQEQGSETKIDFPRRLWSFIKIELLIFRCQSWLNHEFSQFFNEIHFYIFFVSEQLSYSVKIFTNIFWRFFEFICDKISNQRSFSKWRKLIWFQQSQHLCLSRSPFERNFFNDDNFPIVCVLPLPEIRNSWF